MDAGSGAGLIGIAADAAAVNTSAAREQRNEVRVKVKVVSSWRHYNNYVRRKQAWTSVLLGNRRTGTQLTGYPASRPG
jgi:hypothetical protein